MSIGRVASAVVSSAAVVGCAIVVVGMTRSGSTSHSADGSRVAQPTQSARPAFLPGPSSAASTTSRPVARVVAPQAPTASTVPTLAPVSVSPTSVPVTSRPVVLPPTSALPVPIVRPATRPALRPAAVAPKPKPRATSAAPAPRKRAATGQSLPLRYTTGSATRVITVSARSSGATTGTLQAWTKVAAGKWKRYGGAVSAYLGADGVGTASESRAKTPTGSFTLTQAFGRNSDPGTPLRYFRTTPSDYWISSPGSRYNTHQRCSSCGYNNGVNERLYYVTPEYNYGVVIDYNTRNAPGGVRQGGGSAFFLHVAGGSATAGCVAISQQKLISLLKWLTPSAHPRILIGVS